MLKLTKTGIGLLTKQYKSVLRKCLLLNLGLFSSLVVLYNCALAMEMGSFEYNDAAYGTSSAFADNGYMIPSKTYMTQGTGGVYAPWWMYSGYAHSVISSSATVAQNLERIDAVIGAFGFSTNGANYNFFATMRNEPTSTIKNETPIMANLINLDHVLGALPSGTYVSNMQSMGDNVKALDTAIGAKIVSDGHYIKKSYTNSITANLSALDYALYNYYYTFRVDERIEVIDYTSFFQKDFSTLQMVDLHIKNLTHLGAFSKCDEACPRPSERFSLSLSQEQMFKNDASVDAGTSRHCLRQFGDVVADLLKNTVAKSLRIYEFMNEEV